MQIINIPFRGHTLGVRYQQLIGRS